MNTSGQNRSGKMTWRVRQQRWFGRVREADGRRSLWLDLGTDDEGRAGAALAAWVRTGEPPGEPPRIIEGDLFGRGAAAPAATVGSQAELDAMFGKGNAPRFPEPGGSVERDPTG